VPRLVGKGQAMELILTGTPIGADDALRIGLVNPSFRRRS
jgi:enoyl-CoA hydratase/carnithine racemase